MWTHQFNKLMVVEAQYRSQYTKFNEELLGEDLDPWE